ncbi:unnamed protein product [Agarophyton chilense]|eukprot:gb/GEZJ01002592.1/.p1 GENE.gb/GEZJ01002592.1/~~gb/GEZJ01002592.1/.p1  ORF type:complete len:347 (+),score=41.68 gb/GEZJ01002592.1/:225-1265(+)
MNLQSGRKKTIVDPSVWDSCEIGGKEAVAQKDKVCSMRSSLFKKNAAKNKDAIYGINCEHDQEPIFRHPNEVEAMDSPFQHETISLDFCEYGKANKELWPKDIFAVFHNAVRSELKDLTILMKAIKKVGAQLRVGDFSVIRPWWKICAGVLLDYMDAEQKYLIPWIKEAIEKKDALSRPCGQFCSQFHIKTKEIRSTIHETTETFKQLCDTEPEISETNTRMSNALRAVFLVGCFDALVYQVGNYLNKEEELFPEILASHYPSEKNEKDLIMGKMIKFYVTKGRDRDIMLVLLTRWMTDVKTQKRYRKALLETCDCNYKSIQTKFEVSHAGFVQQYRIRAGITEDR